MFKYHIFLIMYRIFFRAVFFFLSRCISVFLSQIILCPWICQCLRIIRPFLIVYIKLFDMIKFKIFAPCVVFPTNEIFDSRHNLNKIQFTLIQISSNNCNPFKILLRKSSIHTRSNTRNINLELNIFTSTKTIKEGVSPLYKQVAPSRRRLLRAITE